MADSSGSLCFFCLDFPYVHVLFTQWVSANAVFIISCMKTFKYILFVWECCICFFFLFLLKTSHPKIKMNQMNDDDFSQCTTTRSQLLGFSIYELRHFFSVLNLILWNKFSIYYLIKSSFVCEFVLHFFLLKLFLHLKMKCIKP